MCIRKSVKQGKAAVSPYSIFIRIRILFPPNTVVIHSLYNSITDIYDINCPFSRFTGIIASFNAGYITTSLIRNIYISDTTATTVTNAIQSDNRTIPDVCNINITLAFINTVIFCKGSCHISIAGVININISPTGIISIKPVPKSVHSPNIGRTIVRDINNAVIIIFILCLTGAIIVCLTIHRVIPLVIQHLPICHIRPYTVNRAFNRRCIIDINCSFGRKVLCTIVCVCK